MEIRMHLPAQTEALAALVLALLLDAAAGQAES